MPTESPRDAGPGGSLIRIGRLGRPHGLNGEVALESMELSPSELSEIRSFTWRGPSGQHRDLILESARPVARATLVRFSGIADRDAAASLTRGDLWAERERFPDPGPGMAYTFQLVGLPVFERDGRALGTLFQVMRTAAHPLYVIRDGERELMVPATKENVVEVDLEGGRVVVALPAGLEEL